ncbi:MAG TPA: hypothetical protein VGD88_15195 [Opitutaceae bacterium]
MDLILDNLQLILVIAGSIAYWLNQRKREQRGEAADYDEDGIPENRPTVAPNADAMEEEQRTRRIQEEIRRKIQERRAGGAPAAPVEPPPLREEAPAYEAPVEEPSWREQAPRAPQPPPLDDGVLARQRALQEQLQALAERRAALEAARSRASAPVLAAATATHARPSKSAALLRDLRDPESTRRAIVLREVLGPPVALR